MEKQERKEWLKAIGKAAKAIFRLVLTVTSLITKFIAIGCAKISDWTILLSDRLAD